MNKFKKAAVFLFAVTMAFSVTACGNKTSGSQNSIIYYDDSNQYSAPGNNVQDITESTGNKITAALNEKSSIDDVDLTITKVTCVGRIPKDTVHTKATDAIVCFVDITNNSSDEIRAVSTERFSSNIDGDFSSSFDIALAGIYADMAYPDDKLLNSPHLAAGESASGYIVFEAATGWKDIKLMFSPSNDTNDCIVLDITPDMVETVTMK